MYSALGYTLSPTRRGIVAEYNKLASCTTTQTRMPMVTHDHTRRSRATTLTAGRGKPSSTLITTEARAGTYWDVSTNGADPTAHLGSAPFALSIRSFAHVDLRPTLGGLVQTFRLCARREAQQKMVSTGNRNCIHKGCFQLVIAV